MTPIYAWRERRGEIALVSDVDVGFLQVAGELQNAVMSVLIVVPARYGSSRFPGKPLADLAGRSMVLRVAARARAAAIALAEDPHAGIAGGSRAIVATDDERIADHVVDAGFEAVMTDPSLANGSTRALAAADALGGGDDIIVNLQGDAPFTPVEYVTAAVRALVETPMADVATPCVRLSWPALDALRQAKADAPFSGTTCVVAADGRALWFSKQILPAIRNEADLRAADGAALSPVRRHVGLYAYRRDSLRAYAAESATDYEKCEGLEQLRLLETGRAIMCVDVSADPFAFSGVDTPADLDRAARYVAEHGDPDAPFFAK